MAEGRKGYTWESSPQNRLVTPWDGKVYRPGDKVPLTEAEAQQLRTFGHRFAELEPREGEPIDLAGTVDISDLRPAGVMGTPVALKGDRVADKASLGLEAAEPAAKE